MSISFVILAIVFIWRELASIGPPFYQSWLFTSVTVFCRDLPGAERRSGPSLKSLPPGKSQKLLH